LILTGFQNIQAWAASFLQEMKPIATREVKGKTMRNFQSTDGLNLYPLLEKKSQSAMKSKGEPAEAALSEMVEFLCSPHRTGRYRQCSLESDVEYMRWLMERS
jgi:hypothetical protein